MMTAHPFYLRATTLVLTISLYCRYLLHVRLSVRSTGHIPLVIAPTCSAPFHSLTLSRRLRRNSGKVGYPLKNLLLSSSPTPSRPNIRSKQYNSPFVCTCAS